MDVWLKPEGTSKWKIASREKAPFKAGAEREGGGGKTPILLLEHKDMNVFIAGLYAWEHMRIFIRIKLICCGWFKLPKSLHVKSSLFSHSLLGHILQWPIKVFITHEFFLHYKSKMDLAEDRLPLVEHPDIYTQPIVKRKRGWFYVLLSCAKARKQLHSRLAHKQKIKHILSVNCTCTARWVTLVNQTIINTKTRCH